MPARIWPVSLPQLQLADLAQKREANVIAFKTDAGATKRRRRSTKAAVTQSFSMQLTGAQLATFETFWADTLQDGVLDFEWTDAVTDATVSMFLTVYPEWNEIISAPAVNDRIYEAKLTVEIV